jgi:dipeptide/tripeptide permease
MPFFYSGLALIVVGHRAAQAERQHAGRIVVRIGGFTTRCRFSIFYMGINLGAVVRTSRGRISRAARRLARRFRRSGVGMTFGLVQYIVGRSTCDLRSNRLATRRVPA